MKHPVPGTTTDYICRTLISGSKTMAQIRTALPGVGLNSMDYVVKNYDVIRIGNTWMLGEQLQDYFKHADVPALPIEAPQPLNRVPFPSFRKTSPLQDYSKKMLEGRRNAESIRVDMHYLNATAPTNAKWID